MFYIHSISNRKRKKPAVEQDEAISSQRSDGKHNKITDYRNASILTIETLEKSLQYLLKGNQGNYT